MGVTLPSACVDVVVDVTASRLDAALTYLTGVAVPPIGARVRVPLGTRLVDGWVVSEPRTTSETQGLKPIDFIDETSAPLDPVAIALARWMHRRYACTFREALAVVAARGASRSPRGSYAFASMPPEGDEIGAAIYAGAGGRRFTALAALRMVRATHRKIELSAVIRELNRLVRAGIINQIAAQRSKPVAARRDYLVCLLDKAVAKGAAQRRLAAVLEESDGPLPLSEAAQRARTSPHVVRRAAGSGLCEIREARGAPARSARGRAFEPTPDQRRAIAAIDLAVADCAVLLLHGITGSGKTFVYARAIDRLRARGERAIVLVPEISLTPQTAGYFSELYGARVGVLHSGLSEGDRSRVWEDARAGSIDVVVGARSAVFAPLPNLKLIVVDEEHEPSYKQDVAPRYDTAAVARERMRIAGGAVVLGSATPSLESYWEARTGKIRYERLEVRATNAPLPPVEIIDMTSMTGAGARRPLGPSLVSAIEEALRRDEKVMLFVNRRGYAGLLLCRACGFVPRCKRCAISLVVHSADGSMRCHVCGDAYKVAQRCPKCGSDNLKPFGFGTQRVEEEAKALFPDAGVVRMDSDTTTARGSHGRLLGSFATDADILIGTQMIAKGLDFPTVSVVGVVSADIDLNRPDFRAAERTFSLLTQVAGRAGRAGPGARVVVQTYSAEHYAVRLAARHDFDAFAEKELGLRKELRYPPFGRLAYVALSGVDAEAVMQTSAAVASSLRSQTSGVEILGPAPEPLAKARGEYRMRVAVKADDEQGLLDACAVAKTIKVGSGVRLTVIVDPR